MNSRLISISLIKGSNRHFPADIHYLNVTMQIHAHTIEHVDVFMRQMSAEGITPSALMEFHTCHKFTVMAHSQAAYRRLGCLVAEAGSQPIEALAATYMAELMAALKQPATRRGRTNVLMHLLGFLRPRIDKEDRAELLGSIESYRRGLVSLITPITLLNHHFRHHPNSYVSKQH